MKSIHINEKSHSPILIPSINLEYGRYDDVIDSIVVLIFAEIDECTERKSDEDFPTLIKKALDKFENSLFGKHLLKQMHVDKYFFKYLEEFFIQECKDYDDGVICWIGDWKGIKDWKN